MVNGRSNGQIQLPQFALARTYLPTSGCSTPRCSDRFMGGREAAGLRTCQSISGSSAEATRTVEGTVLGTAAYMAPEQAQGKPADGRSDVFSFGAVLYEMLCGTRAFGGNSIAEMLSALPARIPRCDPPASA